MQNRLNKELTDLQGNPLHGVVVHNDPNNRLLWTAAIMGPEGTAYSQGKFNMAIKFPENYPFKAPQFVFTTKIFHPNINEDGTLCEDMIETKDAWQPTKTVRSVLEKILNIMGQVNTEQSLNNKAMELYKADRAKFEDAVRAETAKYAK